MLRFDFVVIFAEEVLRKEKKKAASKSASNRIADFLCTSDEELLYEFAQYLESTRRQHSKYYPILCEKCIKYHSLDSPSHRTTEGLQSQVRTE